jgi:hypothetical protein
LLGSINITNSVSELFSLSKSPQDLPSPPLSFIRVPGALSLLNKMKSFAALLLASLVAAAPAAIDERQIFYERTDLTENELSLGLTCRDVIFIWARGSTELGNMVCT